MDSKSYFFIGVGGIGMSALARFLLKNNYAVSGSDLRKSENISELIKLGLSFKGDHSPSNIKAEDTVIYSSGIKKENIELVAAKKLNCRMKRRGEFLAEIVNKAGSSVVVCGAHGKSTTSAIMSHVLEQKGFTSFVGAIVKNYKSNYIHGEIDKVLTEGDESDGSFLLLKPEVAIITNVDYDHMDFYKSKEAVHKAYNDFLNQNPNLKKVIINTDDLISREKITIPSHVKAITIGQSENCSASFSIKSEELMLTTFLFKYHEIDYEFKVPMNGLYNVTNTIPSIILGIDGGLSADEIQSRLLDFKGLGRRYDVLRGKPLVVDDYAHHPEEIKCIYEALSKYERFDVYFQPHRFSRTSNHYTEFVSVLKRIECLYILPVFSAGEEGDSEQVSKSLIKSINKEGSRYISIEDFKKRVGDRLNKNNTLVLGAGSISNLTRQALRNSGV